MVKHFGDEVESSFVGQTDAVRLVRNSLHDFVENPAGVPLILHLVGPAGTGKSLMAEIIAKSLFDDCESTMARRLSETAKQYQISKSWRSMVPYVGVALDKVTGFLGSQLQSCESHDDKLADWRSACGIVHKTVFLGEEAEPIRSFLDRASQELKFQPKSVLILDDFNNCDSACATNLKDLLSSHIATSLTGETVSASQAVIIICSDLTNMGLSLSPSESYETALEKVSSVAIETWGRDSLIISKGQIVPFAPLSDHDIIKIIDLIMNQQKQWINKRIVKYLQDESTSSIKYEWRGRFYCEEDVKLRILDMTHEWVDIKNARAITEDFTEQLKYSYTHPEPIERRLTGFKFNADASVAYNQQDIVLTVSTKSGSLKVVLNLI